MKGSSKLATNPLQADRCAGRQVKAACWLRRRWTMVWLLVLCALAACTSSARKEEQEIKKLLATSAGYLNERGVAELEGGRYHAAVEYFHQALALTSYDPVLHNNLGVAFFRLGWLDSAIVSYEAAVRLRPHYFTAYRNLAGAYLAARKTPLALKAIDLALQHHPDAANYSLRATIHEQMEHYESAVRDYRSALSLAPDSANLYNNLGALYFRLSRLEQAMAQFELALQKEPTHAAAAFNLANALARQCRLEESRRYYEQALQQAPAMYEAENNLGLVLLALNDETGAIDRFRRAHAIKADADVVLHNLSLALARLDSLDAALALIDRALQIQPDKANYHQQRGAVLAKLQRPAEARSAFLRAIALDSTLAVSYHELGNVYYAAEEISPALQAFQQALERYPDYVASRYLGKDANRNHAYLDLLTGCDAASKISADYAAVYLNLGKSYLAMNEEQSAEQAFRKAVSLQPQRPDAYEWLAVLYQQRKQGRQSRIMTAQGRFCRGRFALELDSLQAAERYGRQALQLHPRYADALALMAEIRIKQKRLNEAEAFLQRAMALEQRCEYLWLVQGDYQVQRRQMEKALAAYAKALQINPDSVPAHSRIAALLLSLERTEEAAKHQAEVHFLQGREFETAGQLDRSLREYGLAAELMQRQARYLTAQGLVYVKKHVNDEAEQKLHRALQLDSLQVQAWYGLGVIHGDRGAYDRAISYLQKAISLDSLFGQAHYSLAVNYYFNQQPELARRHLAIAQTLGVVIRKELQEALQAP
ncbi:MAG TPA: tetratricopeptide repeat protein [bacterium]|nr:tetratricopeptide repeat protein [bacterium]